MKAKDIVQSLLEGRYNYPDYGEQEKPEHWEGGVRDEDTPEDYVNAAAEQVRDPIKKLEVYGRRWYRPRYGGVYCKAYIYVDGQLVHVTPEQYGYNDQYLTLARDWLIQNRYISLDPRDPLWLLRDQGIEVFNNVVDVKRERDL